MLADGTGESSLGLVDTVALLNTTNIKFEGVYYVHNLCGSGAHGPTDASLICS